MLGQVAARPARGRKLPLLFFFCGSPLHRHASNRSLLIDFFFLRIADACVRKVLPLFFFFPGRRYSGTRQKYSIRHAAANFFQSCGSLVRQKSSAAFFSFFSGRRYSGTRPGFFAAAMATAMTAATAAVAVLKRHSMAQPRRPRRPPQPPPFEHRRRGGRDGRGGGGGRGIISGGCGDGGGGRGHPRTPAETRRHPRTPADTRGHPRTPADTRGSPRWLRQELLDACRCSGDLQKNNNKSGTTFLTHL